MSKNTFHVYQVMEKLKQGESKKNIGSMCGLSIKDFEQAWKNLKSLKRIVTLRRKTFALNGTVLTAILSVAGKLAS